MAVIAPLPSMFGGRVSSRTTCSCCSCSSAASSIVTMRSALEMKLDSVLSSVVFPEPVPPEMMMFSRALMAPSSSITISGVKALKLSRSSSFSGLEPKRRMETAGTVQGQRRNDGVDTRAVRQAGVDHRADFVDAPADLRDDAVDDLQQVVVVAELDAGLLHLAAPLDVDVLRAVDQDVADRVVLQQHFQRSQAEGLVEHLLDQPLPLVAVEQRVFRVAQVLDDQADLAAQHVAFQFADLGQVELVDQLAVDAVASVCRILRRGPRRASAWWGLARHLADPS